MDWIHHVVAMAKSQGYDCYTLSFDYGQRHRSELEAAKRVSSLMNVCEHKVVELDLGTIGGSALTDTAIDVPEEETTGIPVTYVPARNTVFLSIALGWAEVLGANDIFLGVNAVDYSGYPDCRPEYISAFETVANLATKSGVEGQKLSIHAPLIDMTKAQIIQAGLDLSVDYSQTVSCYKASLRGLPAANVKAADCAARALNRLVLQTPPDIKITLEFWLPVSMIRTSSRGR